MPSLLLHLLCLPKPLQSGSCWRSPGTSVVLNQVRTFRSFLGLLSSTPHSLTPCVHGLLDLPLGHVFSPQAACPWSQTLGRGLCLPRSLLGRDGFGQLVLSAPQHLARTHLRTSVSDIPRLGRSKIRAHGTTFCSPTSAGNTPTPCAV